MSITPTSPITGSAQTGLTSPTYTFVADTAPNSFGKQHAVTTLGGTQTGVTVHSASAPFTGTIFRPAQFKTLPFGLDTSSIIRNVPKNVWKVLTRKAVTPAVNQPVQIFPITTTLGAPAGSETYDIANLRAAISHHIGLLTQVSAALGDSVNNGTL